MGNSKVIRWRVSWVRMDGECWGNGFTLGQRLCLEILNYGNTTQSYQDMVRRKIEGSFLGWLWDHMINFGGKWMQPNDNRLVVGYLES